MPWYPSPDETGLFAALRSAHSSAECGDIYCGCWDSGHWSGYDRDIPPPDEHWPHGKAFLAKLDELGWQITRK